MNSSYDFAAVVLFLCMVAAFMFLTNRRPHALSHLLVSGVAIAVANQLGNAGFSWLAGALLVAGAVYAFMIVRSHPVGTH